MSPAPFPPPPSSPRPPDTTLLGRWRLLRADAALDFAGGVIMDFRPNGQLLYTIPVEADEMVIELIYRVEGNTLRTDNPLAPHATATQFEFGAGDVLILDFAGSKAWFIREL